MPKCMICGKKYDTLSALQNHHRSVHPGKKFVAPRTSPIRMLTIILVLVLVAVGGSVGYLIYAQSISNTATTQSGILNTPISATLYDNMTGVSLQTLSTIGSGSGVTPPTSISGAALSQNGLPEVLYIGAEYCPYCAAERWSLVVALSHFGNFSNIEYMQSAENDGNIATVSFRNASFASQYLTFVTVENEDRSHAPLQSTSTTEQQLWNQYTNGQLSFPFIYIGNSTGGYYYIRGAQYSYSDLSNLNWTQIGSQLSNPNSNIAQAIDGTANTIIHAVCQVDGNKPSNVCDQSYLQSLSYSFYVHTYTGSSLFLLSGLSLEKAPPESLEQSGPKAF
jgi:hypothetical protein